MACKTPIIGSKIGGLTDYIEDGRNGFFFEPGNAQELASKIEKFYKLPDQEKEVFANFSYETAMRYEKNHVNKIFVKKLYDLVKES